MPTWVFFQCQYLSFSLPQWCPNSITHILWQKVLQDSHGSVVKGLLRWSEAFQISPPKSQTEITRPPQKRNFSGSSTLPFKSSQWHQLLAERGKSYFCFHHILFLPPFFFCTFKPRTQVINKRNFLQLQLCQHLVQMPVMHCSNLLQRFSSVLFG